MLTLTYGYKKPETGDRGSVLFTALQDDVQRVNDHTHNGIDSAPLPSQSVLAVRQTLSSTNWVTYGGPTGFYRQLVTLPAGFSYDTVQIGFRLPDGSQIFPHVEKVSDTSMNVYTDDNTTNFIGIFGG